MLENWEECNSAIIIAGGGEDKLPLKAPRPSLLHQTGCKHVGSLSLSRLIVIWVKRLCKEII